MWEKIKGWIERHPYLTGALVLGILLIWIVRRSAAQSSQAQAGTSYQTGPSDALQAAELSAGVQQQQAYYAAQTQIAGYNASVNATQLQTVGQLGLAQISAGVQNDQTAAQLQLGLAQLGFTPGTSPFGLTMPIAGVTPVLPGGTTPPVQSVTPVNPSIPTQPPPVNPPILTITPGVTPQNPIIAPHGAPSITESEFSGITQQTTGAGLGGPVQVPSVPIFGPVDANGNPSFEGYTNPTTIPSSNGLTWQQYHSIIGGTPALPQTPGAVDAATAANIAAQLDYLNNPNSCHNRVCH